jgi:hypothetical protein
MMHFPRNDRDSSAEERTIEDKRVILAPLSRRVHATWQVVEEIQRQLLPAEALWQPLAVHADNTCLEAQADELLAQARWVAAPERVAAFQPGQAEQPVPVGPQPLQVEVAEDDHLEPFLLQTVQGREDGAAVGVGWHRALSHRAAGVAVAGHDHELDRQAKGVSLFLDELAADAVHRDAVVGLADAGDQSGDEQVGVVQASVVQSEGTVLAAAPQKGGCPWCVHGRCRWAGPGVPQRASPTRSRLPCLGFFILVAVYRRTGLLAPTVRQRLLAGGECQVEKGDCWTVPVGPEVIAPGANVTVLDKAHFRPDMIRLLALTPQRSPARLSAPELQRRDLCGEPRGGDRCVPERGPLGFVEASVRLLADEWASSQGCQEMASDAHLANTTTIAAHKVLGFTDELPGCR